MSPSHIPGTTIQPRSQKQIKLLDVSDLRAKLARETAAEGSSHPSPSSANDWSTLVSIPPGLISFAVESFCAHRGPSASAVFRMPLLAYRHDAGWLLGRTFVEFTDLPVCRSVNYGVAPSSARDQHIGQQPLAVGKRPSSRTATHPQALR